MSDTPSSRGRRLFGWLNDPDEPWWERPGPTSGQQRRDIIGAFIYLALALGVVALTKSYGLRIEDEAGWRAYLAVALMVLPLSVRRRWPLPVLVVASVAVKLEVAE